MYLVSNQLQPKIQQYLNYHKEIHSMMLSSKPPFTTSHPPPPKTSQLSYMYEYYMCMACLWVFSNKSCNSFCKGVSPAAPPQNSQEHKLGFEINRYYKETILLLKTSEYKQKFPKLHIYFSNAPFLGGSGRAAFSEHGYVTDYLQQEKFDSSAQG